MFKNILRISLPIIFICCVVLQLVLTGYIYTKTISQWFTLYLVAKVVIWLFGTFTLFIIIYLWRRFSTTDTKLNFKLLTLAIGFTLWTVELVFSFVPASETTESSLTNYTWMHYYRKPINEHGFRDESWEGKNPNASGRIVFIGDSYTEGFGLKDTADRFSNIVANYLGSDWLHYNMGRKSATTSQELKTLYEMPFKPDILVWQYLFNDAEDVCEEALKYFPDLNVYVGVPPLTKWFIKRSYVANFFYFRWRTIPAFKSYNQFFIDCIRNTDAIRKHFMQLDSVDNYCKKNNVLLIPIIIPYMNSINTFSEMTDLAFNHFCKMRYSPVVMYKAAEQTPVNLRSVSSVDAHPSKYFSRVIADSIFCRIKESQFSPIRKN